MSRILNEMLEWLAERQKQTEEDLAEIEALAVKLKCDADLGAPLNPIISKGHSSQFSGRYHPEFGDSTLSATQVRLLRKIGSVGNSLSPATTRSLTQFLFTDPKTQSMFGKTYNAARNNIRKMLKEMRENPSKYPSLVWTRRTVVHKRGFEYLYHLEIPGRRR